MFILVKKKLEKMIYDTQSLWNYLTGTASYSSGNLFLWSLFFSPCLIESTSGINPLRTESVDDFWSVLISLQKAFCVTVSSYSSWTKGPGRSSFLLQMRRNSYFMVNKWVQVFMKENQDKLPCWAEEQQFMWWWPRLTTSWRAIVSMGRRRHPGPQGFKRKVEKRSSKCRTWASMKARGLKRGYYEEQVREFMYAEKDIVCPGFNQGIGGCCLLFSFISVSHFWSYKSFMLNEQFNFLSISLLCYLCTTRMINKQWMKIRGGDTKAAWIWYRCPVVVSIKCNCFFKWGSNKLILKCYLNSNRNFLFAIVLLWFFSTCIWTDF